MGLPIDGIKKLHLNGVKVYFLCNYQWVDPLNSSLCLAWLPNTLPGQITTPLCLKGLRDKILTILYLNLNLN